MHGEYFSKLFKLEKHTSVGEYIVKCPLHKQGKEEHPSAHVNLEKGVFHCKTCDVGLTELQLYAKLNNLTYQQALQIEALKDERKLQLMDEALDRSTDMLLQAKEWRSYLYSQGFTEDTIRKYRLGFNGDRITIPIFIDGELVDERKYDPFNTEGKKMLGNIGSHPLLYPFDEWDIQDARPILLVEGEKDSINARERGFNALTHTGGASAFPSMFAPFFKGKKIYILYDNDVAGQEGSINTASILVNAGVEEVYICSWEGVLQEKEDITDFFVKYTKTSKDLEQIILQTAKLFTKEQALKQKNLNYTHVDVSDIANGSNMGKALTSTVMMSGRLDEPMRVPSVVHFSCSGEEGKLCSTCPIYEKQTKWWMLGENNLKQTLELVEQPNQATIDKKLRWYAGIPEKCESVKRRILAEKRIDKVTLIPDFDSKSRRNVLEHTSTHSQVIAYLLEAPMQDGMSYRIYYKAFPHPNQRQRVVAVVNEVTHSDNVVNTFKVTPDIKEQLKNFQGEPFSKMQELYERSTSIHRIYEREMFTWGIDLVYHSPLQFKFGDWLIKKGYPELLIIGETRPLALDTMVATSQGFLSLGEIDTESMTPTIQGKGGIVGKKLFNNEKTIELVTYFGNKVRGTKDHRMLTTEGWKEIKDLKIGDKLLVRLGGDIWGNGNFDPNLARLVGYLVADGSIIDRRLEVSRERKQWMIDELLPYASLIKERQAGNSNLVRLSFPTKWLRSLGFNIKEITYTKEVPLSIRKANKEAVIQFLKGYLDADGSLRTGKNRGSNFEIASASQLLISQVQSILINLGIISKQYQTSDKRRNTILYRLSFDNENTEKLVKIIGIRGTFVKRKGGNNGKQYKFYNDMLINPITEINEGKLEPVSCLTVVPNHNFIANGLVTHNTGKSETLEQLQDYYGLGERMEGRRATRSGLIGGIDRLPSGATKIEWGRVVLNHKGLLAIDEASGVTQDMWAQMTDVRSSGIASLDMIGKGSAPAMTRLIWMSNARVQSNKQTLPLMMYPTGVEVVTELIGSAEDISRFDLVLLGAKEETSREYTPMDKPLKEAFPSEYYRSAILWAWTRKPEQIVWDVGVEQYIVVKSKEMNDSFNTDVAFLGTEAWKKIARLSVALATRLISTDDSFENVVVKKHHVDWVLSFITRAYTSDVFRLDDYIRSKRMYTTYDIHAENAFRGLVKQYPNVIKVLAENNELSQYQLNAVSGLDRKEFNELIATLTNSYFIQYTSDKIRPSFRFRKALDYYRKNYKKENIIPLSQRGGDGL